jgi:L-asparaginase
MASEFGTVVILGTGGTIAGTSARAGDNVGYSAAQIGVQQLVAAVPPLAGRAIEAEQVAQLDSKDMDLATWRRLAERAQFHLDRPEVAGLVITHGTDTLEETAYLLHSVLAAGKPAVFTAAMRPATSLQADGPQNLLDAVTVAGRSDQDGVAVVLGGRILAGSELRKVHSYRIDAFDSGDAGPLGLIEEGRIRALRGWPKSRARDPRWLRDGEVAAPWVAIVTSHGGACGREVAALVAAGVQGLVVATTGNGTVHAGMEAALW